VKEAPWTSSFHTNLKSLRTECRLLFGKIQMQSYDWTEGGPPQEPDDVAEAERIRCVDLTDGSIASLYPDTGNVHAFQAVTPAAVLDVLVPGYTGGALASASCSCKLFNGTLIQCHKHCH
jgi:PCO_ADO